MEKFVDVPNCGRDDDNRRFFAAIGAGQRLTSVSSEYYSWRFRHDFGRRYEVSLWTPGRVARPTEVLDRFRAEGGFVGRPDAFLTWTARNVPNGVFVTLPLDPHGLRHGDGDILVPAYWGRRDGPGLGHRMVLLAEVAVMVSRRHGVVYSDVPDWLRDPRPRPVRDQREFLRAVTYVAFRAA